MGRAMGRYSVTGEEKAATLRLAGWYESGEGVWHRPLPDPARYPAPLALPHRGQGYSLDGAFRIWRDEP